MKKRSESIFFLKGQLLIPVYLNSPFIPTGVRCHLCCTFSVPIYLGLFHGSHLCSISLFDSVYPNSLIAQLVKNLPAMQETPVRFLERSAGEGIGYPIQYSWASLVAQLVENLPAMWETWVGKIPWRRARLPAPVFWPGEFHGLCSP